MVDKDTAEVVTEEQQEETTDTIDKVDRDDPFTALTKRVEEIEFRLTKHGIHL